MKEYKTEILNPGGRFKPRRFESAYVENVINEYVSKGWQLQQIVSPDDGPASLAGVFYREK